MEVLILCEYSGTVRDAFIAKGHDAISCDILPTDSDGPHYQGDCYDMLHRQWDLIVAHPPCTHLAVSGNAHYGEGTKGYAKRIEAAQWTQRLWERCKQVSNKVAFENPVSVLARLTTLPKASYAQPYQHGHLEQKKTGFHLDGLKPLSATNDVYDEMMALPIAERQRIHYLPPSPDRWKIRSTTFKGIATAMAAQWGES
tara:strand:+ start:117 stop:713 length:597 start_codon:yes stop_codon:yes gene_type:complete